MAAQPMAWGERPLTRRALLAHLAVRSAEASTVAVLGSLVVSSCADAGPKASGASNLPELAASTSKSSADGAQVFKTCADLHPPVITMSTISPRQAPGYIFTDGHDGPAYQGPMIIDGQGELVWTISLSPGSDTALRAFNFRVQQYKGKPVITWFEGAVVEGHGQGHYEVYDGTYNKVTEVYAHNGLQGDLHEFVITPEGTALFTAYGQATADLSAMGGQSNGEYFYGVAQEVDLASGKLLWQWDSHDHVGFSESYVPAPASGPWDYFHINSINVDPSDGNLIISGRNAWTFYKVNRKTGAVMWRLGGKQSDFDVAADAHFAFQHDVTPQANGTFTVFDNEAGPPVEAKQSRGLVLSVDQKARTVRLLHAYLHNPPVLSWALGSVQDLSDGSHFVGWGQSSYFTEYGGNGDVLLDGRLVKGTVSYRAFKQLWTGRPVGTPDVAVVASAAAGKATVYASFNGSTETSYWVVLGGKAAGSLSPVGRAKRMGFETAISVPNPPAYVAVQAVTAAGQVLAQSATVSV